MLPTRDSGCKGTKKNEDSSYCYDVFYICLTFFMLYLSSLSSFL